VERFSRQTVSDIKSAGVDVELAIQDVRQRYEMLARYRQPVTSEETKQIRNLKKQWQLIKDKAHYTNFKLIAVKSKFTSLAQLEISDFADLIRKASTTTGAPDRDLHYPRGTGIYQDTGY